MKRCARSGAIVVISLLAVTAPTAADSLAVRFGAYTEAESVFLGAELRVPLDARVVLAPNLEYVFVDNGTYVAPSADLHYRFRTRGQVTAWAGGGLGIYLRDPEGEGSNADVGLNVVGGVGLRRHLEPHIQAKLVFKGDTEFVLGFGIRF
jgi:hypothetical protein